MAGPSVIAQRLIFTFDDPARTLARVARDCDDAVVGPRRFRRTGSGWRLAISTPDLLRLEYRLSLTAPDGSVQVVCDPANPERVRTAFGERSVALLPGYRAPDWLDREHRPGRIQTVRHHDPGLGELPIDVWSPPGLERDEAAPLLIVHDGPEYADLAA
ncbi:MAG: hypothetical protein H0V07_02675, partial [Propionibacteriales bacterium]|nr:hypothetical protein [Propionibacteriales bacterium]